MAHSGKAWPLHLRRDFTLDRQTYNGGLAVAYHAKVLGLTGLIAQALLAETFDCVAVFEDTLSTPTWESVYRDVGGRDLRLRMSIDITPADHRWQFHHELWDRTWGKAIDFAQDPWGPPPYRTAGQGATFIQDRSYPYVQARFDCRVDAVRFTWPEWNAF